MIITLEIAPGLEQQLRQEAARVSLAPEAYIIKAVQERLTQTSPRAAQRHTYRQTKRSCSRTSTSACRQPSGSGIMHWWHDAKLKH